VGALLVVMACVRRSLGMALRMNGNSSYSSELHVAGPLLVILLGLSPTCMGSLSRVEREDSASCSASVFHLTPRLLLLPPRPCKGDLFCSTLHNPVKFYEPTSVLVRLMPLGLII